jgi:acetyl esterase/lipase
MKLLHLYKLLLMSLLSTAAFSQEAAPILLYPNGVPNSKPAPADYAEKTVKEDVVKVSMVTEPTITPFFPEKGKANGTAVVICPGGGYGFLATQHEGYDVAKKFNELGITAFVLKYRLPSDKIMVDRKIGPLQDAQRSIQIIRQRAVEWNIDTAKIGIMGFSAGGHLASTAGTHFNKAVIENKDSISLRPNFMLLIYPVITFGELTHKGSKNNLVGKDAPQETVDFYSNEKQVTANTPPTFLVQSQGDKTVPVQNSLLFYEALLNAGVKAELHIYQAGGHGYGLNNNSTQDYWFDRCTNWLKVNKFLK